MRKVSQKFITVMLSALLLTPLLLPFARTSADTTNLINNPSVETATNNLPANWSTNRWGTNTAIFNYDQTGHTGNRSISVSVTNYASGDAKWMADQVPVTAGETYTYSDYSISSNMTELDAAYVSSTGTTSYAYLKSIAASSTWRQSVATFTVPAGVVSVSIYHIIYSNGSLQTDDFSLTAQSQTPTPPPVPTPPPTTTNLIANPSFETANGSDPSNWQRGGWGTNNTTYTYVNGDAHTGTRSASIAITSYSSGDAKWYANPVSVTAGSAYTYQDYYKATTVTRVVVAMTSTSGDDSYTELANAPATSSWAAYSSSFTVPAGIKLVTIYHLLDRVGALTIDDVSLIVGTATTPPPPSNPIANPSLETANGSQPADWYTDNWGTNSPTFTYVNNDGHTGTKSVKVAINNYQSGDAKWYFAPLANLTPGSQYSFSAWYKTNTQPHMVATYVDTNGDDQYLTLPNPDPGSNAATTWQQYSTKLYVPAKATSVTVLFLLSSNGWLQTDDFSITPYTPTGFNEPIISLTFDDGWESIYTNGLPELQKYGFVSTQFLISGKLNTTGYMTTAEAKTFQAAGNEIGSHTVTHPDLTTLSSVDLAAELSNSQSVLRQLFGAGVAQDFASPYGTYNATVIAAIRQYYQSHRSTDVGYNSKDNFNPYDILVQDVQTNTTPADVAAWVAKAKADKTWLVLVFHQVSTSSNPNDYAVTPGNLDQELANLKSSGVAVETIAQALAEINSQL